MPVTLSSSNRGQLSYKAEGNYPTNFGVLQGGNGTNLQMLSESFDFNIKNESSKSIRSDRQTVSVAQVGASASGGFAFESVYREYDPFILGVLQTTGQAWTEHGTLGVGTVVATITVTSATVLTATVAPTGASAWNHASFTKGCWFTIIPDAGASTAVKNYLKGRAFRAHQTTALAAGVITLDAATPIDTAIMPVSSTLSNAKISLSTAYNGADMKSWSFEVAHADVVQYRQYLGYIPSKMEISLSPGNIVTGSFDFMGKTGQLVQTTGMGTAVVSQSFTPANATRGVFDIVEGNALISATTYIKSGSFSIDNSLRAQEAVGVFGNAGVGNGSLTVTGKLEVYFATNALYDKFVAGAASSLSIPILDVNGNGYVWLFPNITYTAAKLGTGGQDQDNMLSVEFTALMDSTATASTYQKTVACYRVGAVGSP